MTSVATDGPDRLIDVPPGLRGVAVTDTELGDVRGGQGFYHYRQYSATELARHRSFEDVWRLLLDGALPGTGGERDGFAAEVRALRDLPDAVMAVLPAVAAVGGVGLDGLRTALSLVAQADGMAPLWEGDPGRRRRDLLRLVAVTPTLVAALSRLAAGLHPVEPEAELDHAANYLHMLHGQAPTAAVARATPSSSRG